MSTTDHEDLSHALEVLADGQAPAGPAPVADLLRRGRRSKRRRAATMTGAVAAIIAVAVAGGAVLTAGPTSTVAGPAAAPSGGGSSKPSDGASSKPGSPGSVPNVAELLAARIPAGYRIENTWNDPGPQPLPSGMPGPTDGVRQQAFRVGALHSITNGTRSGNIRIEVGQVIGVPRHSTGYKPHATCGNVPKCAVENRPDGSQLYTYLPDAAAGLQDWRVTLYRTDGSMITASSNTIANQGDKLYPSPLLDGDQLTALALDPVWQHVADTAPDAKV
ncbi:hypothetical protein [Kitasatospora sp. CB01950]|uniref:hypothetical protein n=1 Tax=Kitasatospora sp. CB01950 TaxID=1703930 RepID=UPI00093C294A|nr:hypothetical protein [Kitasatospora sp. CB01950]OKJ16823.1 hypothetical protein AMK19_01280 [Kitasatospora sp. CB01950]